MLDDKCHAYFRRQSNRVIEMGFGCDNKSSGRWRYRYCEAVVVLGLRAWMDPALNKQPLFECFCSRSKYDRSSLKESNLKHVAASKAHCN